VNEDIADFVQDKTERRFYAIHLNNQPVQLSFDEIYKIWKDFCVNATPRMDDWQAWYNTIDHVNGLASEEINYHINRFRDDPMILQVINSAEGTYITPPVIIKAAIEGKPTLKEKKAVIGALDKLVGKPPETRRSKYKRKDLINAILELKKGDAFDEEDDEKDNSMNDLPF